MDLVFTVSGPTFALLNRGVEQLVARWAHNPKVTSSSLVPATKAKATFLVAFFMLTVYVIYSPSIRQDITAPKPLTAEACYF